MSNGNRRHPGITARQTKNRGTVYEVRLRTPDGRELSKTFSDLSTAKRWRVEQQRARNRGLWIDPRFSRTTFGKWSEEWLRSNPLKRERTLYRDRQVLNIVNVSWGLRPMDSLTPEDCRRLVNGWIAKGYASSSIQRMAAVVKAILNSAVEADLIGRSPWRGVKTPQVVFVRKESLSPSEVFALANEVRGESRLVILTAALCGLRFGECAGLRIMDVDLDRQTVSVRRSLGEVGGRVVINPPKSRAGDRTLLMPQVLLTFLASHVAHRSLVAGPSDLLFTSAHGGPLRYGNFRSREFAPACERLGLDGVTFHDLRRFNATLMVTSGVDVKTVQVRLGHSDPRITLAAYALMTSESEQKAVAVIEEATLLLPALNRGHRSSQGWLEDQA